MDKQEQIKKYCRDRDDFPYKIPDNYGEGISGKIYHTGKTEKPREVYLEIDSFKGICWDAVHYYGKLNALRPPVRKEGQENLSFGGYLGEDTDLFKNLGIEIEIIRPVTDLERKKDPERYWFEYTNGFYTKEEIIDIAKKIFRERFIGDWKLTIMDHT